MKDNPERSLAISVSHNRICVVFLIGKQPMDWEISYIAAASVDNAAKKVRHWMQYYAVSCVITENLKNACRKSKRTHELIYAVQSTVKSSTVRLIVVRREQPFQSKYEQIDDLCERFPQMKAFAPPKRKYWENEPHSVSYFEALALAVQYFERLRSKKGEPPTNLPT